MVRWHLHTSILVILSMFSHGSFPNTTSYSTTTVRASTGVYVGRISPNFTDVREFLSITYGRDTAGRNRFMPPKAVPLSSRRVDTTEYAKACPQYVSALPTVWNQHEPQELQYWMTPNNSAGEAAVFTSEDCLKIAIWTPANASSASKLPVAMFWTGGGFQTNGILVLAQLGGSWVQRSRNHIVVTVNYRMNILGFPNAAGLRENNLGLLDQRMALEWVRDNIACFGGDPGRITVWGQSAGAISVDIYHYAYWQDPIAQAFFAQSGSTFGFPVSNVDVDHTNFTFVAKSLGCDYPEDAFKKLRCMQKLSYDELVNFQGKYQDNSSLINPKQPSLTFSPIVDQRTVFSNYTERYLTRQISRAPMIYSSCANEGASLVAYPPLDDQAKGVNKTAANIITTNVACGAAKAASLRHDLGISTWIYQYAGNCSNQDPYNWMGVYHASDLVMLFGTSTVDVPPVSQPLEITTSEVMEDMLLAFIRDPWGGLDKVEWPKFDPSADNGGSLLRFGTRKSAAQNVSANTVLAYCSGEGEWDPFPT